jgi:predicted DNA binding CopG/RHH family protein
MDKVEPTSIRLPHSLIIDLRALAEAEGFSSYQTYLKVVLTQHVKEKKKAG